MMEALELGAEDFNTEDEYFEITTDPADFSKVRQGLENKGYILEQAEISMVPTTYTSLNEEQAQLMEKLIDNLEDHDDVQNVYHNWNQD